MSRLKKKKLMGVGEMAQWLRALTLFRGSEFIATCNSDSGGPDDSYWSLWAPALMWHVNTHPNTQK